MWITVAWIRTEFVQEVCRRDERFSITKKLSDQLHKHIPLKMIIRGQLAWSIQRRDEKWIQNSDRNIWSDDQLGALRAGYGPVAGPCERPNEHSYSVKSRQYTH